MAYRGDLVTDVEQARALRDRLGDGLALQHQELGVGVARDELDRHARPHFDRRRRLHVLPGHAHAAALDARGDLERLRFAAGAAAADPAASAAGMHPVRVPR